MPSGGTATLTAETTPSSGPSATPIPLPADIAGKVWLVDREQLYLDPPRKGFVGGTLDGSIREVFPVDWDVLAFDGTRVVTVDQADGTLTVSDRATRAAVVGVPTGLQIQQVTLTPDALYWTGATGGDKDDGGVWMQRFDGSAARALVPPGPYPPDFAGPLTGRTPLVLSASGRTLATSLCDPPRCLLSVIDTETGESGTVGPSTGSLEPAYVTDDVVVAFGGSFDLPPTSLIAFDRTTLQRIWQVQADAIPNGGGLLTSGGKSILQGLYAPAYGLETISVSDGRRERLWDSSGSMRFVIGDLSSELHVVLMPDLVFINSFDNGMAYFDILDVRNGAVSERAGYIDARGD